MLMDQFWRTLFMNTILRGTYVLPTPVQNQHTYIVLWILQLPFVKSTIIRFTHFVLANPFERAMDESTVLRGRIKLLKH